MLFFCYFRLEMSDKQDLAKDKNDNGGNTILLEQDKLNCIGCGACIAVAPDHWEFSEDGTVSIIDGKKRQDAWEEKNISKPELQENMDAAESCPVNVIHLTSIKDGKRLI